MNTVGQDFYPSSEKTLIISNSSIAEKISKVVGAKILPLKAALDPQTPFNRFELVIYVCAVPIAVRAIAKLQLDKAKDPAIVCVDETLAHCVVLLGAHKGGNQAARYLETTLNIQPVITTASDLIGAPALDQIPNYHVQGDLASVQRRINETKPVTLIANDSKEVPKVLDALPNLDDNRQDYVIEVERHGAHLRGESNKGHVLLTKRRLVLGLGCSSDCSPDELSQLVQNSLGMINADLTQVLSAATIDIRKSHPAVLSLGLEVKTYGADQLRNVQVPNPSQVVDDVVGTTSVAEAACLLGASVGGKLVLEKQRSAKATVAIAQTQNRGTVSVVGIGPGSPLLRTRKSEIALRTAEVVIGFEGYLNLCDDALTPGQLRLSYKIGDEIERVDRAINEAANGATVALVCSGDPGVYAMASLLFERRSILAKAESFDVEVVPGVTAALAAASTSGAILGHDHAYISLSDLLTPWALIKEALIKIAPTHLALIFYNPRSKNRQHQFREAMEIMQSIRGAETPVLVAKAVSRVGQRTWITSIGNLDEETIDMETVVIVGGPWTVVDKDVIYTRRGYKGPSD